jgi:hypothetical protein
MTAGEGIHAVGLGVVKVFVWVCDRFWDLWVGSRLGPASKSDGARVRARVRGVSGRWQ